jgi:predicted metalloprotease with PDZ domain
MSILSFRRSRRLSAGSRRWLTFACGAVLLCGFASAARAQQVNVTVQVFPGSPGHVVIEGNCEPTKVWSFRNDYAGVSELGSRVEGLKLFDPAGAEIPAHKIAPGQFEAATAAARFRYEVNLAPPAQPSDAARVSWLNEEHGLLMLADLLPVFQSKAANRREGVKVLFKLPAFCAVYSNEKENAQGEFAVADADRAVFLVGTHLRSSHITISGMAFGLVTDGEWAFADGEALKLVADVLKIDREVFGAMPSKEGTLILLPFPQPAATSKWSAETRGSTTTLLMGKLPSKTAALSQLSVPLTHELFHLWVPNALALEGDYDWFYEGFTVYQAARTAVRLGLLTVQEFLNAIARAYDAYAAAVDHGRWSLVEASKRRWTVGAPSVYSKSMVVAFLYDLKLRNQSHGKHSLDDVYRKMFQDYHSSDAGANRVAAGQGTDGNEAAANALASDSTMQGFVRQFIREAVTISLVSELAPFGLRVETFGLRTRLSVSGQLSKPQRDLLRELGYNDSARSPTQKKHS